MKLYFFTPVYYAQAYSLWANNLLLFLHFNILQSLRSMLWIGLLIFCKYIKISWAETQLSINHILHLRSLSQYWWFMVILRIANNNHAIFHTKLWTLQHVDALCLKAHYTFPSVLLTCFNLLFKHLWLYCMSALPPAIRKGGWWVICALWFHYQTDGKSLTWYSQCYVCARRRERKSEREAQRCYHLPLNPWCPSLLWWMFHSVIAMEKLFGIQGVFL